MNLQFNQNPEPKEETQELSDFGNQYLSNIPEEHREIVGQYVKEWDGNVTRKFQEYSGQLKKYEELGDLDQLTNAYQVLTDLQSDPVGFFEYFRDYLQENEQQISEIYGVEDLPTRLGIQMEQEQQNTGEPGINDQIQELTSQLNALREENESFKATQQERDQMAMLDKTLSDLHTEHGDFDETYVLSQIAGGKTPQQAIESFNNLKQSIIDSRGESAPNLLSGPAGTPLDQVDKSKLKNASDRKALGAALLQAANKAS